LIIIEKKSTNLFDDINLIDDPLSPPDPIFQQLTYKVHRCLVEDKTIFMINFQQDGVNPKN
jgi:hypothetical protein